MAAGVSETGSPDRLTQALRSTALRTAEKLEIHRSTFMSKLKKYEIN